MDDVTVLLVDDDPELREVAQFGLARQGLRVELCESATDALQRVGAAEFDCIVTDLAMPGMHGFELIERIVANQPELPVIVLTGSSNLPTAVAALRAGAYDFLTKPLDLSALVVAVRRASERKRLRAEVTRLRRVVQDARRFGSLVGASGAMQVVYSTIEQTAPTDATVLITGQSGTGKEIVARAIHQASKRAAGPFVHVECAAIPEAAIEAELFGHARGAFGETKQAKLGRIAQADKGTLFLDEIAELPLAVQVKLVHALRDKRLRPLGGDVDIAFDLRLVCASDRELHAAVADGSFREDLYYAIDVVQIALPPLKARAGDVLLLAQHFVEHFARMFDRPVAAISPQAAERLMHYAWPGNVRELRNAMERAVAMCAGRELTVEDLPDRVRAYKPGPASSDAGADLGMPLDEVERRHILRVLDAHGGNKVATSQALGIDRKTLYRKLLRYGVERE